MTRQPASDSTIIPSAGASLRVVHADDDLVVVDKPSGMPSVPARTPLDPPDVARVLATAYPWLEAAHRLDRDTSGLLVLARSREIRGVLGRSFEAGLVAKRYLAVVRGCPPAEQGELHLPLADDPARPPRKRVDPILGRRATTRWRLLDRAAAATLLELEPVTGRSHQLRVHLAWLGCPIVGDRLYGRSDDQAAPLALRSVAITLPHPRTGLPLALVAGPPSGPPWAWFRGPWA